MRVPLSVGQSSYLRQSYRSLVSRLILGRLHFLGSISCGLDDRISVSQLLLCYKKIPRSLQFSSVSSVAQLCPTLASPNKSLSIESVMPSSHLILCHPLLLLLPVPPSIRVFSKESTLHMRWPKYLSFSFSISPSNEHPGLISLRMDWLDLLAV